MRRSKENERQVANGKAKVLREYGWWSGQETKNVAYGELERCLRNGYTEIRDYETVIEMGNVLHLGGGRIGAKEPKHDDRPDGLSIAHAITPLARVFSAGAVPISSRPDAPAYGSMEWLDKILGDKYAAEHPDRAVIGNENAKILA